MAPALGLPARAGVRTDARPGLAGCGLLPCQVVSGSVLDHERDIHAGGGTGRGSEYIGAGSALFVVGGRDGGRPSGRPERRDGLLVRSSSAEWLWLSTSPTPARRREVTSRSAGCSSRRTALTDRRSAPAILVVSRMDRSWFRLFARADFAAASKLSFSRQWAGIPVRSAL